MDNIKEILNNENIDYSQSGSKIKINIDRNSLDAAVLISRFKSVAKFDEVG